MIVNFADKTGEDVFDGVDSKAARQIPPLIWKIAARKLDMLNAAHDLRDLKVPSANRVEALKSQIIIKEYVMIPKNRKPTHPGEILLEEFLKPKGISQLELGRGMSVPIQRVNTLINGKRDMTAETAILLSRVLKTSSEFWMNLQVALDLYEAQEHLEHAA